MRAEAQEARTCAGEQQILSCAEQVLCFKRGNCYRFAELCEASASGEVSAVRAAWVEQGLPRPPMITKTNT